MYKIFVGSITNTKNNLKALRSFFPLHLRQDEIRGEGMRKLLKTLRRDPQALES